MTSLSVRSGASGTVNVATTVFPDGSVALRHVVVDANSNPIVPVSDASIAAFGESVVDLIQSLIAAVTALQGRTQVAQMKMQLAADGFLDAVEAALTGGPADPAYIAWTTGGYMSAASPLATIIASVTGKTAPQMSSYIAAAALHPV